MAEPGDGGPGRSWFAVEVTSEPVEPGTFPWPEPVAPEYVPESGGGHHGFMAGPITVGQDFEQKIPARIRIKLPRFESSAVARVAITRPVEFSHAGQLITARNVEVRFTGVRNSAQRWGNLLDEDEEILTLI